MRWPVFSRETQREINDRQRETERTVDHLDEDRPLRRKELRLAVAWHPIQSSRLWTSPRFAGYRCFIIYMYVYSMIEPVIVAYLIY
jgi:hypothetical protein